MDPHPAPAPLAYTLLYLAEKILTSGRGPGAVTALGLVPVKGLAWDRRDDQVERLARHALRGAVWDKALAYGRQAGDKAQTRSAYREAVVCFEQALAALEHLPESYERHEQDIDLRLDLRITLNVLGGDPRPMLDHLRCAETLAQAIGDDLRLGWVYANMSTTFWVAGEVDRAIVSGRTRSGTRGRQRQSEGIGARRCLSQ